MKILNNATISSILTGSLLGNASTATKLSTARTIALTGGVSGSASFDGSANATITAVVADDSHNHIISNVDNLQSTLDSKAPMATATATLPATVGWYRVATSVAGIARCSARFEVDWTLSGIHGQVTLNAGIMYNEDPTLNQVQYIHFSANGLTKARIVYHTTFTGNYAYLEVYNNSASALVVTVQMFSTLGWTLVTPSTVGSIPAGYTSREMDFADGFSTEGIFKSSIATGTAPLTVLSTTKVTNLNADLLDGYNATTASQANTIAVSDANNNITATKFTGNLVGNADTSAKLATARTISLVGDVTGSVSFDGSANASITTILAAGGAMNVLQFLNSAEIAQVKGTAAPTLDMSVNVQAYINASITAGANKLYFPKGKYRFKNINLYDFSCAIEGEILIANNVTNTAFFLPATQDSLFFYGTQDTISFSGIAFVSEGTWNDTLNTGVYKMNRTSGSSISVNNIYATGFSGNCFDTMSLIDSNFTNVNADWCKTVLYAGLGDWNGGTTITLDKWYLRHCDLGIIANNYGQSRMTDVIVEFAMTKAIEIKNGSWTIENLYLEYNTYGVDATDSRLSISSWFGFQRYTGDAIHNEQNGLGYYDRGTSTLTHKGATVDRLEYEYTAPRKVLDGVSQATDTWWEAGEWLGGTGGSGIEIEFRGSSNFWQNQGGDGVWNTVGKTVLRATIANNAIAGEPNINAYMYQEGHGPVKRVKLVANNPERTAFKVYVLLGQYTARVVMDAKISLGYWLNYCIQGVSDPGAASSSIVDVVNSFKIVMASGGYMRVKESGTLDLKTTDTVRGYTNWPAQYAAGMPVIVNGVQYFIPLVT